MLDFKNIRIEIGEPITKEDALMLLKAEKLQYIQISNYIDEQSLRMLNEVVFSKRDDICFRVYGFYFQDCNLSFLQHLSNVSHLIIHCIKNVENIDIIATLPKLQSLHLGIFNLKDYQVITAITPNIKKFSIYMGTTSNNFNTEWLLRFSELEELSLGNVRKNIECISAMLMLTSAIFHGITFKDLSFINKSNIEKLSINWGCTQCFSDLVGNIKLKEIELWRISKLSDISFLNQLPSLASFKLWQLRNIYALPELSCLKKLNSVDIDGLKNLADISSLGLVENLKKVKIYGSSFLLPDDLIPVLKNKSLEKICCYSLSNKKNEAIEKLINEYGKTLLNK